MSEEKIAYLMLFCALILVKNHKATLEQLVLSIPLMGKAKYLTGELIREKLKSGEVNGSITL